MVIDRVNNCTFTIGVGREKDAMGNLVLVAGTKAGALTQPSEVLRDPSRISCALKYGGGNTLVTAQISCSNGVTSPNMVFSAATAAFQQPFASNSCEARFRFSKEADNGSGMGPGMGAWGTEFRWKWEKCYGWAQEPYAAARNAAPKPDLCGDQLNTGMGILLVKPNGSFQPIWHLDYKDFDYSVGRTPSGSYSGTRQEHKVEVEMRKAYSQAVTDRPNSTSAAPEFHFVTYGYAWSEASAESSAVKFDEIYRLWALHNNPYTSVGPTYQRVSGYAGCFKEPATASAPSYPGLKDGQQVSVQGYTCLNQHP
ncbi:hypothetical protein ACWCQK_39985 [Streptomyces sp. NPDC002306]